VYQFFDFPLVQQTLLVRLHPRFLIRFITGVQLAGYLLEVLASVVEIDNLNGIRKVFSDQIPYPFGAIADDHLLFRNLTDPTAVRMTRGRISWKWAFWPHRHGRSGSKLPLDCNIS